MNEQKLVLEFLNDLPDYAYGFEAGRLYQLMRNQDDTIEGIYNTQNLKQIMLMAQKLGYSITTINHQENWVFLKFEKCSG